MPLARYRNQESGPASAALKSPISLQRRENARVPASLPLRLQPQLYCLRIKISLRRLAIFLNGSLSVFALRRTAKVVRFRALAMVSTLFALRTSARSSLSRSGVQGRRGVPVISPSPSARHGPVGGWLPDDLVSHPEGISTRQSTAFRTRSTEGLDLELGLFEPLLLRPQRMR